ncbi:hypothetical protein Hanom_Chr11g01007621 [Helianthus anomalus]
MMPQQSITSSQWACVTNQNQSIQNLLLSESETGNNNRPPKLNHMNDYPSWKGRSHTYENDKKAYDLEKKAFAILTQAPHKDIYHQFGYCTSTKALWDALVARGDGNAATRKTRHDLLKKEFEAFQFMENETLNDMTTRFFHLISEVYSYIVLATQQEMVARLADVLPPKKLENKDEEEIRKGKCISVPQNTEMYLGGFNTASSSIQQQKLQRAFVSNTSPFPQSAHQVLDPSANHPPPHLIAQAHALSKPPFGPSVYFGKPQVPTQEPKLDPSAWLPKPNLNLKFPQLNLNLIQVVGPDIQRINFKTKPLFISNTVTSAEYP